MEGEKFGKLREAKECQFGNIEDHTLRNLKHFFFFTCRYLSFRA